jgi:glycosyltransferase involved in cell wall biosynthesis
LTEQVSADFESFSRPKVVVGIPCYNEEKTIAKIILQLQGVADQIIVCDDGSSDMTSDIAKALHCHVITHSQNWGKGAALRDLFIAAREDKADVFVTMDGDGQHNTLDVTRLILPVIHKECDIAVGSRFEDAESQSEMPGYRRFGSGVINSLVRKSSGVKVRDTQSGFRAYSGKVLSKLIPGEDGFGADAEILSIAASYNLSVKEISTKISYAEDLDRSTQNPFSHSLQVIGSTIKFASLKHPLIFYGLPCVAFFIIFLAFGSWTLLFYSTAGRIPFGPAVASATSFITSAILGAVAVILYSLTTVIKQHISV